MPSSEIGVSRIRHVDTGLDPVSAEREQWDDGNNTLAIAPGVVVAYERNTGTNAALREAAQAHYDVVNAMRREQQRLIDEADRIQRKIDELEKSYQDMTTPRPPAITP